MTEQLITVSKNPGELIAAIPALLTFTPAHSVVLIGLIDEKGSREVSVVARCDLPTPEEVPEVVQQLHSWTGNNDPDAVAFVIITNGVADSTDLPQRDLANQLLAMIEGSDVTVGHALWVERIERGSVWRSYTNPTTCGPVADPARFVLGDTTIYANRDEFEAQLTPDPTTVLDRRSRLLRTLPSVRLEHDLPVLRATIDQIDTDRPEPLALDDDAIVRLGHTLTHPGGLEAGLQFALSEQADAAERLWNLLTRAVPRSIVASPACLLTTCAYLRGSPLASAALRIALAADPDHTLTTMLSKLLYSGVPPHQFREYLTEAFRAVYADVAPASTNPTPSVATTTRAANTT